MYKTLAPGCIGHPVGLEEAAPVAEKYGYKGIWFDIVSESKRPIEQTLELLEKHHLKAAGFSLPVEYRYDEETFKRDMESFEDYVKYASACGMKRCVTWIWPFSDEYTWEENYALHRDRLREAAKVLKKYDMNLGLEFLGPPKLRRGKKYEFIHTLEDMLQLGEDIGTGNLGILMDVWHWDMAGQVFEDFKKFRDQSQVVCVHIMDAPAGIDREEQEDLIRALPGSTGVLRIEEFFRGLTELGYDGPVMAEPFEKKLNDMSFEEAAKTVSEAIDSVWPKEGE